MVFRKNKDYDNLKKVLNAKSSFSSDFIGSVDIRSLEDVFSAFDKLVNLHPYYFGNNVKALEYMKNDFGSVLDDAVNNNKPYVIDEVCFNIGEFFSPKTYNPVRKKIEKFAFSYALRSLISQYKLSKLNVE